MTHVAQAELLSAMFAEQVARRQGCPAMHFVQNDETVTWSWNDLDDRVARWTAALYQLGIRRGDHVAHWSPNRVEWVLTDLALHCLGAIHVPVHSTLSAEQAVHQMVHSQATFAIVADDGLFNILAGVADRVPREIRFGSYAPVGSATQATFGQVANLADMAQAADPAWGRDLGQATSRELDPDTVTTILYSSGTTGEHKGVMLSQRNLIFNAKAMAATFADEERVLRLNFLPLSHIFGRTCDIYTWLARGSEIALAQNRDTIIDDCQRFHPDIINGVPFFFERVRQKLEEKAVADQPGILRRTLGGKIRGCFSGGGALAEQTYDYYFQQDLPLLQGYGLTESSPVISFSTLDAHQRGSAGKPLQGVQVRVASDGEILTKGPHVMVGYWQQPAATADTIQDGWLHTGDLGQLSEDGQLRITGRKDEMMVTATGKNIFPSHIEALLCRDPLIIQAVVVGDRRNCLAALIVPDPDVLKAEIKRRRLWVFSRRGAVKHKQVIALYRQRIDHQLRELAHHEQVPLFRVLDRGFTIEDGYLTAKLSLCRKKIEEDFDDIIQSLYARAER